MKKEDFLKLGFTEEQATKAAAASADELKEFIPKSRFDEVNTENKTLKTDITTRDKQLETLKNSTGDVEGMKKTIADLQEKNATDKANYEAQVKQIKIDSAVERALTGAKAKNVKAVKALLDLEKAELDGDNIKGLDDQLKKLQESEDSKFLFNIEAPAAKPPQFKGVLPGASGDNPPGTKQTPSSLAEAVQMAIEAQSAK